MAYMVLEEPSVGHAVESLGPPSSMSGLGVAVGGAAVRWRL